MIQDEAKRWFLRDENRGFIGYLPEEALVIGHKIKISDVARSAFVVLVNELVLELLDDLDGLDDTKADVLVGKGQAFSAVPSLAGPGMWIYLMTI